MITSTVEESSLADIAAAELRLGVTFPPDPRESLLRPDGVEFQHGTLRLDYYGPPPGAQSSCTRSGRTLPRRRPSPTRRSSTSTPTGHTNGC
ncbi:hypothetical protein ABZW32_30270 [Streptomyces sp. NPDC004667]|uniref:hypothetical protein n=1 Tax=Streptomyces sp. NPDC004667 TaxID=3154285 RepID=UPI0033AF0BD4